MNRKYAQIVSSLNGYLMPSTTSQLEGILDEGLYLVLEERLNYPTEETDYVRVYAPHLGANDTWICSRWKDNRYAVVDEVEPQKKPNYVPDSLSIPEKALVDLLPNFYEFGYDLDNARYPFELDGVKLPMGPPYDNNCCTFVEALLVKAWQNEHNIEWTPEKHGQMMILSSMDYFSPITACIQAGIAEDINIHSAPPPWTVVQGWRHQWRGGHTFIIVDHDPFTDRVLVLESNSSYGLDGVGFRNIGKLRHITNPGPQWKDMDMVWTWEKIKSTYRYRKLARLKVTDRKWLL